MKNLIANFLLIIFSTSITLAAGELILRTLYPQDLGIWYETREGLAIHCPSLKRYLSKFQQLVEINSYGMRDREHTVEKPEGVFRILVLGDSFMEALQVGFEESLPHLLETRLAQQWPRRVEVLNASVSGWGTDDELKYLTEYGVHFKPDLILVAMTLHNDVSDNLAEKFHSFREGQLQEKPRRQKPLLEHATLEIKSYLASHSQLYQLLRRHWRSNSVRTEANLLDRHVAELLREAPREDTKRGWKMTQQLLRQIKSTANRIGAKTAVFTIPLAIQLSDARLRSFALSQGLAETELRPGKPQEMAKEIAEEEGIELIDLFPAFQSWTDRSRRSLYLVDDGHWNREGHSVAAKIVAAELPRRQPVAEPKEEASP